MAEKSVVRTENAPAPFQGAPYSQAVRYGDLLFVAGQVALRPDHDQIVGEGIEEQTEQACENLKAILEAGGSSLDHVLKVTFYIRNMDDFQAINEVYSQYFANEPRPARALVPVATSRSACSFDAIAFVPD